MNRKTATGCVFAVLSAVIYGSMPLMAKHIYADGVNALTLVFLRNLLSLVPLALLAYRERGTLKIPQGLLPRLTLLSLLGCCLTPIFLFSSYSYIPSGLATVFHFAYPSFVVLANILFLKKGIRGSSVISVLLCVVGISLFYAPEQTFHFTGSALALLSGVAFAGYVILLSLFDSHKLSGFLFSFYVTLISSLITLVICLATRSLVLPSSISGWELCVLFSLLVTTCAVFMFQQSVMLIGGEGASILNTLEPITSVIIGVVVFQEAFGIRELAGTVLVITASIITVLFGIAGQNKKKPQIQR